MRMVSASVVHADGAVICMNGGRLTRRGIGAPVRPPVVCTNRAQPSPTSGSARRSGKATGGMARSVPPSLATVDEISPWPSYPASTTAPSSTSIHARNGLAKRNAPAAWSASRSSSRPGGGGS